MATLEGASLIYRPEKFLVVFTTQDENKPGKLKVTVQGKGKDRCTCHVANLRLNFQGPEASILKCSGSHVLYDISSDNRDELPSARRRDDGEYVPFIYRHNNNNYYYY